LNLTLVLLLVYAVGLIGLGVWIGRRVGTSGGFFVANRVLSPALLFSTVLAANIGVASTVGAASLGYRDGLSAWWWVGSAAVGTAILAIWIGPRIWRVATRNGLYTVGDYLEHRYGRSVRAVVTGLLWIATPTALAAQLIALAKILEFVAGVPEWAGVLTGAVVMTAYFTAGGLLTSAWVNMVQLVVLTLGFAVVVPWALIAAGGWSAVVAAAPQTSDYMSFWQGGSSGWIYLALVTPNFIVSPGLIQKAYGAVDERAIRIGLGATAVALLAFAIAPPLFGMIARVYDPNLVDIEHALMLVLTTGLPTAVGSLGLAAVLSAEISSADAILFMLSTSLSQDLYKRFVRPNATDAQVLRVARAAAIGGGAIGVLLALVLPSIIGAISIFYALMAVCLFVPLVAGLYTRLAGVPEAMAACGVGVVILISIELVDLSGTSALLDSRLIGVLASAAAFAVVAAWRRSRSRSAPLPRTR
jgi:SSS family solute:Na+ symporter